MAGSGSLVEAGRASWARDRPIPEDPRPPIETTPDESWLTIEAVHHIRLVSRHRMAPGEHRPVPPDEAAALIRSGAARPYEQPPPPPPPPPRPEIVFE
jgi:hypothetical protein